MKSAGEAGYSTNVATDVVRGANSLSGLRNAAELVGWAYGAEMGEVSNPILVDKNYVVGFLDRITAKGAPEFEYVEDQMRTGAIKEAKGELYASKMMSGSLEEIATGVGATKAAASNVSLKFPTISTAGSQAEPEVVGMAFAIPVGNVSNPIIGNNGIWVIAPTSVSEATNKNDYLSEQTTLLSRARGAATIRLSNAMMDAGDLQDNRN